MKPKKRIVIGVTGNIGVGKSTVAKIFAGLGAKVIDADQIVDTIYKTNHQIIKKISQKFGQGILTKEGTLNKSELSSIVFKDKKSTQALNKIVLPFVLKIIKEKIKRTKGVVIIDAPLLIESGLHKDVDFVLLVKSKLDIQLKRSLMANRLSEVEIKDRLKQQLPFKYKQRFADFIVDNSSSLEKLKKQVTKIFNGVAK
ncbi:MAG: dephospho-CoA kinase [Candidatus Omnitrophota bacterium]